MNNQIQPALDLAAKGFYVFPIPEGKAPPIKGWQEWATCDKDKITTYWTTNPTHNVGIFTGRYGENGSALLALDVDVKGKKNGNNTLLRFELEGRDLPDTHTQSTPTGGRHIVYSVTAAVKQSASKLGPGLDVRSAGGYIVGCGSTVAAGAYTADDLPIVAAPEWLVELCGKARVKEPKSDATPTVDINPTRAAARATEYLKTAPEAVEGQGGDLLTYKVAAKIKDFGVDRDTCFDLMAGHWNPRCSPPWPDEMLREKIQHAYEYGTEAPGAAAPEVVFDAVKTESGEKTDETVSTAEEREVILYNRKVDWTATGNANLLLQIADGNVRYIYETRNWIHYSKVCPQWKPDVSGKELTRYTHLVAQYYGDQAKKFEHDAAKATEPEDQKRLKKVADNARGWERHCRDTRGINEMLKEASRNYDVPLSVEMLDTDPWLLGVKNGVVDLRTGKLLEASRNRLVTIHSPFDFHENARCPEWEKFIIEVTARPGETATTFIVRPAFAHWLHKVFGYIVTGLIVEQLLFIFNGEGGGGKNVLMEVIQYVLGEYAKTLKAEMLIQMKMERDPESPTSNLADLFRVRLSSASETKEGQKLNVSFIKMVTGDGRRKARRNREDPFEYTPTDKVVLNTNILPGIDHLDLAMRRRLRIVPFEHIHEPKDLPNRNPKRPEADLGLLSRLKAESEGILVWLVQGAVLYKREGLGICDEVTAKTQEYFDDQDIFTRWKKEYLETCDLKESIGPEQLRESYNDYAWPTHRRLDVKKFAALLTEHGFKGEHTRTMSAAYGLKFQVGKEWTKKDIFR